MNAVEVQVNTQDLQESMTAQEISTLSQNLLTLKTDINKRFETGQWNGEFQAKNAQFSIRRLSLTLKLNPIIKLVILATFSYPYMLAWLEKC